MYRFPLGDKEKILSKDPATLHIDREALSGVLYLTSERLVFVGYVSGLVHKTIQDFPLKQIRDIKGGKTMFMIPNVIDIITENNECYKIIIQGRDQWIAAIRREAALVGNE